MSEQRSDPLEALRQPILPVDPDPIFAALLRERVRRALLAPTGETMTVTSTTETAPAIVGAAPGEARLHALNSYICVSDARRALDWYVEALGARPRGEPIVMDDDRIGHAELEFGDCVMMLADEFPEMRLLSPTSLGGAGQSLYLQVPDADGTVANAVAHGAELTRPVADYLHGRNGVINDPFGHRWMITTPPAGEPGVRHGDVVYASLWVPDVEIATEFYHSVLGWEYEPGDGPRGRQVTGLGQRIGLWGGEEHNTLFLCYAVRDVADTVRRVREAGGQADEPVREPHGRTAMCADDQGMRFAVLEEPDIRDHPAAETAGHGELTYLTMEVPDSARARAFYGHVFGWRYARGAAEDGWGVLIGDAEARFMTGFWGGRPAPPTVVPMYAVDDVQTAVARVRAAGGTATDPDAKPYGITAECVDDQGTRFYLAQH